MKKFFSIFVLCFAALSFGAMAQIKVYQDNRVKIFGDRPSDDPVKDLSMQVYGSYGDYLANGKIGFGEDYPLGAEVYIGEYGQNIDSDQLELYGNDGVYLTWGRGYGYGNILASVQDIPYIVEDAFYFQTDVYSQGILLSSDRRYKENIKPITGTLMKLKNVNGVKYNLLSTDDLKPGSNNDTGFTLSEKEQRDIAYFTDLEKRIKENKKDRLGFVAQDLQTIFPELIAEKEDGYLYVDYVGMIPLLVEAIKEQQTTIANLKSFYQNRN